MHSDKPAFGTRWSVVLGGFLLALMGGLSYSWGVFVRPLQEQYGWNKTYSLMPLSIFMVCFAIVMIPAGKLQEKIGTRKLITYGSFFFLLSYILCSLLPHFPSVLWLIFSYGIIGGLGCGITYSCVAPPIRRWFPDFPGLAVSLGVMGFGLASFFFAPLKAHYIIPRYGLDGTFLILGILTFLVINIASRLVVFPTEQWYMHLFGTIHLPAKTGMIRYNLLPKDMIKKKLFWLIWSSFLFSIYGSLLIIGILPSYGQEVVKLSHSQASLSVSFFALSNGLSRPLSGFISDKIGILRILAFVFFLQAIVFFVFPILITEFYSLLIAALVLGLGIGASLSLYPVLTSECFGVEHLGRNYGIVFTAYGFGALAIQMGTFLRDITGSFTISLVIAGVLSLFSSLIIIYTRKKYDFE